MLLDGFNYLSLDEITSIVESAIGLKKVNKCSKRQQQQKIQHYMRSGVNLNKKKTKRKKIK